MIESFITSQEVQPLILLTTNAGPSIESETAKLAI